MALSMPTLWRTFRLRHHHYERYNPLLARRDDMQRLATLMDTWFDRAQGCSVWLDPNLDHIDLEAEVTKPFQQSLIRNSHKIGTLVLSCPISAVVRLSDLRLRFPRLERVEMHLYQPRGVFGESADEEPQYSITLFRDCPLLHAVRVSGIPISAIPLPFHQLTWLRSYYYRANRTFEMLAMAPNLTHAILNTKRFPNDCDDLPTLVNHALRELRLVDDAVHGERGLPSLLPFLTLPALEQLTVATYGNFDIRLVESLIRRSSCTLRHLELQLCWDKHLESLTCLGSPLLSSLNVLDIWNPEESIVTELFAAYGSDATFLPQLHDLRLKFEVHQQLIPLAIHSAAVALQEREGLLAKLPRGSAKRIRSLRIKDAFNMGIHDLEGMDSDLLLLLAPTDGGMTVHLGEITLSSLG
ncbi:SMK-1 domain-containing protein [Mycena chlorophos]|uniref:SMK-1 domain-containing protein n=1 Tax=Mycena chlorophos TaxID=658473 RepID=A0A8H6S8E0_MYCCL|nr:SMK-1 domain-containing protein [Mycena chlorophos]